jgi:hypothetical protein
MLGASFLLGLVLAGSRIPRISSDLSLTGFVIAALLVISQIVSGFFTVADPTTAVLLPVTILFWGPIWTAFFGGAALVGILATRSVRRLIPVLLR